MEHEHRLETIEGTCDVSSNEENVEGTSAARYNAKVLEYCGGVDWEKL